MLYANKAYNLLTEAASAEFLDPEVDSDVKDIITDIQDDLTTNVETVDADDKESNGVDLTAEACALFETSYGYAVDIRDIMRICEAAAEEGEDMSASDAASDVAAANDVSEDDLVIVAPVDVAQEIVEACLYEAKCGKKGKAKKKAKGLAAALADLKAKGFKVKAKKKKK
jgi:hypothetical protein